MSSLDSGKDQHPQLRSKMDKARAKQKAESKRADEPARQEAPVRPAGSGNVKEANNGATLVQRYPLFSGISSADCKEIVSAAHLKEFSRRQTVFFQGDPIRQILLLTAGCVKITQVGSNGTEVILRLSGPGELVGAAGLGLQCNHCSTAQALQFSTALAWDAGVFELLSKRFPILRRNTAHILDERLQQLEERFSELCTQKVAPRLGREIVRLLSQVGRRVNGFVEIHLSREELGQLTGTTLFTVCRLLSQWEQQGIVSTRRETVMVHNLQALKELSERE